MKTIKYIPIISLFALFTSCNDNPNSDGHSHDVAGEQVQAHDDHAHEAVTISYTLFADGYELFVEFPALVAGGRSEFAAHFTQLSNYKPVAEGIVTVSIIKDTKGIRNRVESPSSPGIFRPAIQPKESGTYKMLFELNSPSGNATFEIPDVRVYANEDEAAHAIQPEGDSEAVTFLKEQAWKAQFATQEVTPQPHYSVIRTSGKVKNQPQAETTVNAQAEGTVNLMTILGETVKKGELLAVISGAGIENNLSRRLQESKIAFEKSKADHNRLMPLADEQVVSQKDFLEVRARYRQDSLQFHQMASLVSQNGIRVTAPSNGYISEVKVGNGNFVQSGSPLFSLVNESRILIETYVNQSDFQQVSKIFDAHFSVSGKENPVTLKEIQGQIESKNAFINEGNTRIPVTFSGRNNGQFMPGMFLEAFLKTGAKEETLVIPLSAVIEEQGNYFVFVQTGGESFVKREIELANYDGIHAEIKKGLKPGERIVTRGAYQIKLASMAGELPLHGHTH
ncbi:efflux RND transporter periplasmic adaptor subunit [Marinilabilia salmonicolor]|uniref:efflux RND transporter periplasmic adaptor subunit n=1 Tax=Marinilabilia salmonicolor TaxID=989 RepID=UPI0015E68AC1|nr:efflux RND transporter periplasmic adaptor subunit [Marinilabilia salmonicolor]